MGTRKLFVSFWLAVMVSTSGCEVAITVNARQSSMDPTPTPSPSATPSPSPSATPSPSPSTTPSPSPSTTPGFRLTSGPDVVSVTSSTAILTWSLSEVGTGQVQYGTTSAYGSVSTPETSFDYSTHQQTLRGLAAATTYHYRVVSRSQSGAQVTSNDRTFTTASAEGAAGNSNGIWMFQNDFNEAALRTLISKGIFNIYLYIGYPSSADDSALAGIVSSSEVGIVVTRDQVTADLALMARVDGRLKLWAWAGTWSYLGTSDAIGHQLAKVDISTSSNRAAIIRNIVRVAEWGFYGVQDDTEDLTDNSLTSSSQAGSALVSYWNEEAAALHAVGRKLAPFVPAVWYNFNDQYISQITQPDLLILVPSDQDSQQQWLDLTRLALSKTSLPVVIDASGRGFCPTFTQRADLLPLATYPKVVGYALYEWSDWSADWSCWDGWHK